MNTTAFRCLVLLLLISTTTFSQPKTNVTRNTSKKEINAVLDLWHHAAATTDYDSYFGYMTEDAIFIGTDPTENWKNEAFRAYSKPHFDKGKAWTFHKVARNIYVDDTEKLGWFDELLDTQMGICRGSGVIQKVKDKWKIRHYVLSITLPNANVEEVKTLKHTFDTDLKAKMGQ